MEVQTNRLGHLVDNFLLLFVGLKLADIIEWSWLWVTTPLWGSLLIGFVVAFGKSWHRQTQQAKWAKMKADRKRAKVEADGE